MLSTGTGSLNHDIQCYMSLVDAHIYTLVCDLFCSYILINSFLKSYVINLSKFQFAPIAKLKKLNCSVHMFNWKYNSQHLALLLLVGWFLSTWSVGLLTHYQLYYSYWSFEKILKPWLVLSKFTIIKSFLYWF